MSISFVCQCGKRLKARESSAGKRTMCPKCGNPVGIPYESVDDAPPPVPPSSPASREQQDEADDKLNSSLQSAEQSEDGSDVARAGAQSSNSDSTSEGFGKGKLKQSQSAAEQSSSEEPANPPRPQPRLPQQTGPVPYWEADGPVVPARRVKRNKQLEKKRRKKSQRPTTAEIVHAEGEVDIEIRNRPKWHQFLGGARFSPRFEFEYTLGNVPALMGHMVIHGICACALIVKFPVALQQGNFAGWLPVILASVIWLAMSTYTMSMLSQLLTQASNGLVEEINMDPVVAWKNLARWMAIAAAGPMAFLGAALWYWINCGELSKLDWMILAELVVVGCSYFLVSGTTVFATGKLSGVWPGSVLKTIATIPATIVLASIVFLAGFCGATWLVFDSAAEIHLDDSGYVRIVLAFVGFGILSLALVRWVGTSFFRHRMDDVVDEFNAKTFVPRDMTDLAEAAEIVGNVNQK